MVGGIITKEEEEKKLKKKILKDFGRVYDPG